MEPGHGRVLFVAAPQPGDVDRIAASVLDMTRLHRSRVKVVPLDSLPMTTSGKVDYLRLDAMLSKGPLRD
jgi:acyl-CoA synthetase (AMP-forming)/AMP-acid ligase II